MHVVHVGLTVHCCDGLEGAGYDVAVARRALERTLEDVGVHPTNVCLSVGVGLHPSACSLTLVSYLVDPASSHMLVSKIKPCMSKYKRLVL